MINILRADQVEAAEKLVPWEVIEPSGGRRLRVSGAKVYAANIWRFARAATAKVTADGHEYLVSLALFEVAQERLSFLAPPRDEEVLVGVRHACCVTRATTTDNMRHVITDNNRTAQSAPGHTPALQVRGVGGAAQQDRWLSLPWRRSVEYRLRWRHPAQT
eukprot:CAMPEP_0181183666 /NCGR_PEP_ID=MMETSP1096-20121128/8547_1 /TAXON_ID=156174 ORGANISM="Chrysochromulina ericina, Strain CCMP281" /NCGR_SAMPLE_ID=MMETSP1096 /ASSEMBLY_ACC=CAM_ASM_000453 /LENGTH=160 /DNA_ID=CAMNT_0023272361 /DNA_START=38 /DNA_END=520 /DNA_ORIENTATION=-